MFTRRKALIMGAETPVGRIVRDPDRGIPSTRRGRTQATKGKEAMPKLTEVEIIDKLTEAKGWERHGDMLVRTWQFPSFRRAIEFVNQVALLIEKTDHYPDIHVSFRNVRLEMSTHDVGGLTDLDFSLISQINTVPTDR